MPQAMVDEKINAILVLPQGPYRARDSFCGKMEDQGGLRRLVEDVLQTMQREEVIPAAPGGQDRLVCTQRGVPARRFLPRSGRNERPTSRTSFFSMLSTVTLSSTRPGWKRGRA